MDSILRGSHWCFKPKQCNHIWDYILGIKHYLQICHRLDEHARIKKGKTSRFFSISVWDRMPCYFADWNSLVYSPLQLPKFRSDKFSNFPSPNFTARRIWNPIQAKSDSKYDDDSSTVFRRDARGNRNVDGLEYRCYVFLASILGRTIAGGSQFHLFRDGKNQKRRELKIKGYWIAGKINEWMIVYAQWYGWSFQYLPNMWRKEGSVVSLRTSL